MVSAWQIKAPVRQVGISSRGHERKQWGLPGQGSKPCVMTVGFRYLRDGEGERHVGRHCGECDCSEGRPEVVCQHSTDQADLRGKEHSRWGGQKQEQNLDANVHMASVHKTSKE